MPGFSGEDFIINSIIGENTKLRGEFELHERGTLRIDGNFIGKIVGGARILVGVHGVAQASENVKTNEPFIAAGIVIIGGKVHGHVRATKRLVLLASAELHGNIETPRIVAEEGAFFEGKCDVIKTGAEDDHLSDEKVLSLAKKTALTT